MEASMVKNVFSGIAEGAGEDFREGGRTIDK
jgi:hypothetical protein